MSKKYKCLNPNCNWQYRENQCGRDAIPEWLLLVLRFDEKIVYKCPYCRGKVEEVTDYETTDA